MAGWVKKVPTGPRGVRYKAVWRTEERNESGTRITESTTFDTRKEADAWLATKTTNGGQVAPGNRWTLQEAYARLHEGVEYAPATLALHEALWKGLSPRIRKTQLAKITPELLRAELVRVASDSMRDKLRLLVHTIYRNAGFEEGNIPAVKGYAPSTRATRMAKAKTQKLAGRHLDDGTVERIVAAMPERYRSMIRLLHRVGLRPGEAFALTVGQVDPDTGRLTIDRAVNNGVLGATKTGTVRHPMLPPSVLADLSEHIRRFSDWTDPARLVFTTEAGSMIDLANFRSREWTRAAKAAGVKAVPYDLRHTACSNAVGAGVDFATVADMSGHGVEVLIRTYAHAFDAARESAAEKLEAIIAKAGANL